MMEYARLRHGARERERRPSGNPRFDPRAAAALAVATVAVGSTRRPRHPAAIPDRPARRDQAAAACRRSTRRTPGAAPLLRRRQWRYLPDSRVIYHRFTARTERQNRHEQVFIDLPPHAVR